MMVAYSVTGLVAGSSVGAAGGSRGRGFTLIELLVVISIIALLIGILLPALGAARRTARGLASLSNVRQMGIAVVAYTVEHDQYYPMHSSLGSTDPRTRWPDYLHPYMQNTAVYLSPNLDAREMEEFTKQFAHTVAPDVEDKYHGGYGYNYQYFGNSRPSPTYHARNESDIKRTSETVVIGDTAGSRGGDANAEPGTGKTAVYTLDPPLGSQDLGSRGNGRSPSGSYYPSGSTDEPNGTAETYVYRSFPAERNNGSANFTFADGHGEAMKMAEVDDYDGDGEKDNGYWNGLGDPNQR